MSDNLELLTYQVEELKKALASIQTSMQQVSDAVGVLKMIDMRASQQGADVEKLSQQVHGLHTALHEMRDELSTQILEQQKAATGEIDTVAEKLAEVEAAWNGKYNKFLGICIGISLLSGTISGMIGYNANKVMSKIEADHDYVVQLRTLDGVQKLKRLPNPGVIIAPEPPTAP